MGKRNVLGLLLAAILTAASVGTVDFTVEEPVEAAGAAVDRIPGTDRTISEVNESFLSVSGFAKGHISDRSNYSQGDREYAAVNNETEFLAALKKARSGEVKVIELKSDMYLGWWELSEEAKLAGRGIIDIYSGTDSEKETPVGNPVLIESGISTLTLNEIDGLTIFSEKGASIKHVEIKLNSKCNDIAIRNINFTETWEWDDWTRKGFGKTGGTGTSKRTGFTYLKINGAHNIWVDHCNFGIAFDGNVDIENGSNGISITWCKFGDTDYSTGSMLYRAISYFEDIYQESKINDNRASFVMYGIARDNRLTPEQISKYMGYHKKCHLVGAGDKDTWLYKDENGNLVKNEAKTDANELIRISFGYNSYNNCGSRLPLIRGGVAHMYNCYIDDYNISLANDYYNTKNAEGKTIKSQIDSAGGSTHFLSWGSNPRCGAVSAADTCDYYYVDAPLTYAEVDEGMGQYEGWFGKNYGLIVNSRVKRNESSQVYEGSSWDNNGSNPFTQSRVSWNDNKSTINNWSWGQEGDKLSYSYQVFPLDKVKENTDIYGGCGTILLSVKDWLKTEYDSANAIKLSDGEKEVSIDNISLNYHERTIYLGEYLQLYEKVTPYYATEEAKDFQWQSSDSKVASVNDCGLVKPLKTGKTTITVKTKGGKTDVCEVTVKALPESIEFADAPKSLYVGDTYTFKTTVRPESEINSRVVWERLTTGVEVLDKEKGTIKITDIGNKASKTVQVQVYTTVKGNRIYDNIIRETLYITARAPKVPVTGIKAENTSIELLKGEKITADAAVIPEDATNQKIYYTISDENIAVVDENGCITAKNYGSTTMSAVTMNNGFEKIYKIDVLENKTQKPTNTPEPTWTPTPTSTSAATVTPGSSPKPELKGDVDFNGKVELDDVTIVLKAALKLKTLSDAEQEKADYDDSGAVDLEDVMLVLKKALGLI